MITHILAVAAGHKEAESGKAETIACVVSGLTAALNKVQWKTSGGVDVTDVSIAADYEFDPGELKVDTQTTTLKVLATAGTDTTYTCVITSNEWALTDKETSVTLNVFRK